MIVELVPNPDAYEDIYPSESDETSDQSEDGESESEDALECTKAIDRQVKELEKHFTKSLSALDNANSRLSHLESLMGKIEKPDANSISRSLDVYRLEREKITEDQRALVAEGEGLRDEIQRLRKESFKLSKSAAKEKTKIQRAKEKARQKAWEKKERLRTERLRVKERTKEERNHFWAKQVYRIVLTLYSNSGMTPSSSRRGSVDNLPKVAPSSQGSMLELAHDSSEVLLCLSYITQAASWSPRYDLSISTPSSSGIIVYRTEFNNKTSETWKDAKVILSTTQTSFQGLDEPIPTMNPWRLRLNKGFGNYQGPEYSSEEMKIRRNLQKASEGPFAQRRSDLFGQPPTQRYAFSKPSNRSIPTRGLPSVKRMGRSGLESGISSAQPGYASMVEQDGNMGFGDFGEDKNTPAAAASAPGGGLFGALKTTSVRSHSRLGIAQQSCDFAQQSREFAQQSRDFTQQSLGVAQQSTLFAAPTAGALSGGNLFNSQDQNEATIVPSDASLVFQESVWEETGLTTSYDLPGLRTIPPGNTARRHKIATIELKDIQLSYICIPKLRAAAFLKTRVMNSSGVTLLKGLAGLTLDGSFLGNIHLPRCSAGETFTLPLGVDPAINVLYSRPGVRKNVSSGVFQKEDSCVYTRTVTLTNTKTVGGPIDLVISDQVPVSEDEKLKIDVLTPQGLKGEGDRAVAWQAVENEAAARTSKRGSVYSLDGARGVVGRDEKWGKAVATFKKAGEVEWNVKLNPGKGVRLLLEYDTRFPSTETVVGA